eukprot:4369539-Amphidinium_carterae.1
MANNCPVLHGETTEEDGTQCSIANPRRMRQMIDWNSGKRRSLGSCKLKWRPSQTMSQSASSSQDFDFTIDVRSIPLETPEEANVMQLRDLREMLFAMDSTQRILPTSGIVHGGGGASSGKGPSSTARRPYPFATTVQSTAVATADTVAGEMPLSQRQPPAIGDVPPPTFVLVYHGSFAPMHAGHRECIHTALRFLAQQGMAIKRAVIGFTLPEYVERKTLDSAFSDLGIRVAIAKEVLATGSPPILPIELDCIGQQTSFALACKYSSDETVIYLEGSDLRRRPAKEVLLVTRSTEELCGCLLYTSPSPRDRG